jgi:hypothetical protein
MAKAGHGKGTRKAGGKAAAAPAESSRRGARSRKPAGQTDYLSPLERVQRARRLSAARAKQRPDSWPTIAKAEGLSERQVRRIFDDFLTWERVQDDPDELVDETLATIEASIMELDDVIRQAAIDRNHAARVGAIRLLLEAQVGRWDVLRNAGRLPRHMGRWRNDRDALQLFERLMGALRARGVPEDVISEAWGLVRDDDEPQRVIEGSVAA